MTQLSVGSSSIIFLTKTAQFSQDALNGDSIQLHWKM